MNQIGFRALLSAFIVGLGLFGIFGSATVPPVTPTTTTVGSRVGTLVKTYWVFDIGPDSHLCTSRPANPPAPDIQVWWNGMLPANRQYPFVGFETWRNSNVGCASYHFDEYGALVTFNMASVSNLKGLVTKAELIISTRALPADVTAGNSACVAVTGGAGTLERFGPAAASSLPPVSGTGVLTVFPFNSPDQVPVGNLVFTFPRPWASGSVPGAATPTTTFASATGAATFTVDVTNQVTAALNGGLAGMSWMLKSALQSPPTAPVVTGLDCKTSYEFRLLLTHL